jgi:hypothetical protein
MQPTNETLQGTPTLLPTSEPAAGSEQVTYTVGSGDLPGFSIPVSSVIYIAALAVAGKVNTAATISWRMKLNGSSVATGSTAVAASTYYTLIVGYFNVAVGNVLAISLWSNQTDSNWNYNGYQIQPSQIMVDINMAYYNLTYVSPYTLYPNWSKGNPQNTASNYPYLYIGSYPFSVNINNTGLIATYLQLVTYGIFRANIYDTSGTYKNNGAIVTNATYYPLRASNYIPASISFRYLRL